MGSGYGDSGYPGSLGYLNPYYASYAGSEGGYNYGAAAITAATGQYYKDVYKAALYREQARMAVLDRRKREIQDEAEYERMRPRASDVIARERATEALVARRGAPDSQVWSGKALNEMLKLINEPGRPLNSGPNLPLEPDLLENVNLVSPSFRGSVALLKEKGELPWPSAFQAPAFEEDRAKFATKFSHAVNDLNQQKKVSAATLADLRAYLKSLKATLGKLPPDELTPSQDIQARRFLGRLDDALRAMSDDRVVNSFNGRWSAKGRNVAELVAHLRDSGSLQFAPASPGQQGYYDALYQALRAFERGMQSPGK
jgi:hypothetical protein